MALGGVATGNMKATDELSVQGIMMYSGLRPMERDWGKTQHRSVTEAEDSSRDHQSEKHFPNILSAFPPLCLCPAGSSALCHTWIVTLLDPEG